MPSSHLILCHPLLLLLLIPPSIRVFSKESALRMRWPKYWSFSFSISPSNEHPGLISFKMDCLGLLAVQGTLKSLLQQLMNGERMNMYTIRGKLWEVNSWRSENLKTRKIPWPLKEGKAWGEGEDRGWDGWMASLTRWTWVWATPGVGDGQESLVCCSPWGRKELDTTERLNWLTDRSPYKMGRNGLISIMVKDPCIPRRAHAPPRFYFLREY